MSLRVRAFVSMCLLECGCVCGGERDIGDKEKKRVVMSVRVRACVRINRTMAYFFVAEVTKLHKKNVCIWYVGLVTVDCRDG